MFSREQIAELRSLLDDCTDEELFEMFQDVFAAVRQKLITLRNERDQREPYRFRSRFPDIKT